MTTSSDSERTAPQPDQGSGGPGDTSFFSWLRGLGIVRGSDRWFAGVAGGIAAKAGIDPLIVRGVFVVLALLGGPGLLIYLIGWLLLPDARGRINAEDIFRGRAETWVLVVSIVLAAVVLLPALLGILIPTATVFPAFSVWSWDVWGVIGVPHWVTTTFAWLVWIAIIVVAAFWARKWIMRRGREHAERLRDPAQPAEETAAAAQASAAPGPAAPGFAASADGTVAEPLGRQAGAAPGDDPAAPGGPRPLVDRTAEFADRTAQQPEEWGRRVGERANRWGEQVGRQADEWSARYAEHHETHRIGVAHTVLTLAFALLAAGATGVWMLGVDPAPTVASAVSAPLLAALIAALAVLALSLIVAGVRGRHTGWVGFLSACGVAALLVTVVLPWGTRFQPFGDLRVDGLSAPGAVIIAGDTDVDLSSLDDNPGESGDLEIWQLAGTATVTLPESRPTAVRVRVLAGNIGEQSTGRDGARVAGPFLRVDSGVGLERTSDAFADDSVAHVTVYLLAGNVRIEGAETTASRLTPAEQERQRSEELKQQRLQEERDRLQDELDELEQEMAR